jgi:hypothetical protein
MRDKLRDQLREREKRGKVLKQARRPKGRRLRRGHAR